MEKTMCLIHQLSSQFLPYKLYHILYEKSIVNMRIYKIYDFFVKY